MNSIPFPVYDLIARNALFVVNHSGGKDSQAMYLYLREIVPADQILIVHAPLPEVDWDGITDHIEATTAGETYVEAVAVKTFFEMVEARGMFPSPTLRQCTSDLKRGPIEREIRRHVKANPQHAGLVVSCMGLRAEESAQRSKATVWSKSERNSKAGREWFDWLPIHDWSATEVFARIADAGQTPHWAYAAGMSRLSCAFCIMASRDDLRTAAKLRPALFRRIVETEKRLGHTMMMPVKGVALGLEAFTGVEVEADPTPANAPQADADDALAALLTIPSFLDRRIAP